MKNLGIFMLVLSLVGAPIILAQTIKRNQPHETVWHDANRPAPRRMMAAAPGVAPVPMPSFTPVADPEPTPSQDATADRATIEFNKSALVDMPVVVGYTTEELKQLKALVGEKSLTGYMLGQVAIIEDLRKQNEYLQKQIYGLQEEVNGLASGNAVFVPRGATPLYVDEKNRLNVSTLTLRENDNVVSLSPGAGGIWLYDAKSGGATNSICLFLNKGNAGSYGPYVGIYGPQRNKPYACDVALGTRKDGTGYVQYRGHSGGISTFSFDEFLKAPDVVPPERLLPDGTPEPVVEADHNNPPR
jgi:hypothetical protein